MKFELPFLCRLKNCVNSPMSCSYCVMLKTANMCSAMLGARRIYKYGRPGGISMFGQGQETFLCAKTSRPSLGLFQLPFPWVPRALCPEVGKR